MIVRNVVANATRNQARRSETILPDGDRASPLAQLVHGGLDESPAWNLERDELRRIVRLAVDQLCDRQRQAVRLQRYEHMKYEQIAARLDTSPKAVKSLLSRARERLRDELTPYVLGYD